MNPDVSWDRETILSLCADTATLTRLLAVCRNRTTITLLQQDAVLLKFSLQPRQPATDYILSYSPQRGMHVCMCAHACICVCVCVCVLPQWWVPSHVVCIKMLLCVMRLQKVVMPTEITIPCCQPLSFIVGWLPMLCMHVRMCTQAPRHALNMPA